MLLAVGLIPPFKIVGDYDLRLAPRGSVFRRRYRIERNGFAGLLEVSLADRQARHLQGVSGPTLTIPPGTDVFEYPVRLPPWMETGRTSRTCIMAVGVVKDGEIEYTVGYSSEAQNEQIIAVVETGRLGVEVDRPSLAVVPGGKAELTVRVRRGKGVAGPVKIELVQPEHMHGIRAEPVVVAADQSRAVFRLHFASGGLGPFNMPLVLRATLDNAAGARHRRDETRTGAGEMTPAPSGGDALQMKRGVERVHRRLGTVADDHRDAAIVQCHLFCLIRRQTQKTGQIGAVDDVMRDDQDRLARVDLQAVRRGPASRARYTSRNDSPPG